MKFLLLCLSYSFLSHSQQSDFFLSRYMSTSSSEPVVTHKSANCPEEEARLIPLQLLLEGIVQKNNRGEARFQQIGDSIQLDGIDASCFDGYKKIAELTPDKKFWQIKLEIKEGSNLADLRSCLEELKGSPKGSRNYQPLTWKLESLIVDAPLRFVSSYALAKDGFTAMGNSQTDTANCVIYEPLTTHIDEVRTAESRTSKEYEEIFKERALVECRAGNFDFVSRLIQENQNHFPETVAEITQIMNQMQKQQDRQKKSDFLSLLELLKKDEIDLDQLNLQLDSIKEFEEQHIKPLLKEIKEIYADLITARNNKNESVTELKQRLAEKKKELSELKKLLTEDGKSYKMDYAGEDYKSQVDNNLFVLKLVDYGKYQEASTLNQIIAQLDTYLQIDSQTKKGFKYPSISSFNESLENQTKAAELNVGDIAGRRDIAFCEDTTNYTQAIYEEMIALQNSRNKKISEYQDKICEYSAKYPACTQNHYPDVQKVVSCQSAIQEYVNNKTQQIEDLKESVKEQLENDLDPRLSEMASLQILCTKGTKSSLITTQSLKTYKSKKCPDYSSAATPASSPSPYSQMGPMGYPQQGMPGMSFNQSSPWMNMGMGIGQGMMGLFNPQSRFPSSQMGYRPAWGAHGFGVGAGGNFSSPWASPYGSSMGGNFTAPWMTNPGLMNSGSMFGHGFNPYSSMPSPMGMGGMGMGWGF